MPYRKAASDASPKSVATRTFFKSITGASGHLFGTTRATQPAATFSTGGPGPHPAVPKKCQTVARIPQGAACTVSWPSVRAGPAVAAVLKQQSGMSDLLTPLFAPHAVAVIGVSRQKSGLGR